MSLKSPSLKRRKNLEYFFILNLLLSETFIIMLIRLILSISLLLNSCVFCEKVEDLSTFKKMFMQKRIEQLSAVKNILKLDETKRKVLLDQITTKLFQVSSIINITECVLTLLFNSKVLSSGRVDLENLGFIESVRSVAVCTCGLWVWRQQHWAFGAPSAAQGIAPIILILLFCFL